MYRISKSAEFDKIKFTKWLRSVRWFNTQENNIKEALAIAGRISNGETIDIAWLFGNEFESGEMVCEIVKLEVEENKWVAEINRQAEYNALMARGSARSKVCSVKTFKELL